MIADDSDYSYILAACACLITNSSKYITSSCACYVSSLCIKVIITSYFVLLSEITSQRSELAFVMKPFSRCWSWN